MGDGAEPQSLFSSPYTSIFGLNPKYLRSEYDVKTYVLLIVIRQSDGNVKPGGPLGAFFEKSRLMPAPGFSLPFLISYPSLIYITPQTCTIILDTYIVTHHPAMWHTFLSSFSSTILFLNEYYEMRFDTSSYCFRKLAVSSLSILQAR